MQTIENATIIGRSRGENDLVIFFNEMNGQTITLQNPNGLNLEIGQEGTLEFDGLSAQLFSFEPVMVEELA
jgi:hypothetical protein